MVARCCAGPVVRERRILLGRLLPSDVHHVADNCEAILIRRACLFCWNLTRLLMLP